MCPICPHTLWDLDREYMVPIAIDVEVDGVRVVDTLIWDLNQQVSHVVF